MQGATLSRRIENEHKMTNTIQDYITLERTDIYTHKQMTQQKVNIRSKVQIEDWDYLNFVLMHFFRLFNFTKNLKHQDDFH